jgi:hypothetical protein
MHSLVYLAQLKDFYRRAIDLDPHANPDDPETLCNHQSPSPPLTPAANGVSPPGPSPGKERPRHKLDKALNLPRRDSSGCIVKPSAADVDSLEREWWSSEVVAAWYGPRPGSRMVGERIKGRRDSERDVALKRDASFVGLHDE